MLTLEYTLARHPVHPSSYANIRVHSSKHSDACASMLVAAQGALLECMLTLEYTLARHPVHPSSYANIRVHSSKAPCASE